MKKYIDWFLIFLWLALLIIIYNETIPSYGNNLNKEYCLNYYKNKIDSIDSNYAQVIIECNRYWY